MTKHKFRRELFTDTCEICKGRQSDSVHVSLVGIDINPSDEKLREMIAEKDAEIRNLQGKNAQLAKAYTDGAEMDARILAEKDTEIERLKTSDWAGVTETLTKSLIEKETEIASLRKISQAYSAQITEKDAEIAGLNKSLDVAQDTIKRQKANHPASIKEAIASIDSGPGWVTSITISRTEWFRLLAAIEEIEKDAERYRKMKKSEYFERVQIKANEHCWQFVLFDSNPNFDAAIDALPEVES